MMLLVACEEGKKTYIVSLDGRRVCHVRAIMERQNFDRFWCWYWWWPHRDWRRWRHAGHMHFHRRRRRRLRDDDLWRRVGIRSSNGGRGPRARARGPAITAASARRGRGETRTVAPRRAVVRERR